MVKAYVNSSFVETISYNKETKEMEITFKGNSTIYKYNSVPHNIFTLFILADSIGKFYNVVIKGNFDCIKS